jgi:hypothetical protein
MRKSLLVVLYEVGGRMVVLVNILNIEAVSGFL